MKLAIAGAVLCALGFATLAAAAEIPQYQYIDLGDLPPNFKSMAAGDLNNDATVIGSFSGDLEHEGWRWSRGTLTRFVLPPGKGASFAIDINDRGDIMGHMSVNFAFSDPGTFYIARGSDIARDIGSFVPDGRAIGAALNESGMITGYAELSIAGTSHAFLWNPVTGVLTNLGSPNGSYSEGRAINASGMVAANVRSKTTENAFVHFNGVSTIIAPATKSAVGGRSINDEGYVTGRYEVNGFTRAFLWYKGKLTDLGTLGGSTSSPIAINSAHQVLGRSLTSAKEDHIFLYDGKMRDLTALARPLIGQDTIDASSINAAGYVTLVLAPGSVISRAAVYKKGRIEVLTPQTLLKNGESVGSVRAGSINDFGQIVGSYRTGERTFLATPISLLFERLWDAIRNFPTLRTTEGAAWTAYAKYDVKTSDTQLAKFIADVNTLVAQKKLSSMLAAQWVAEAQAIRAAMKG